MVFCNIYVGFLKIAIICHNPYFNRWFSAMMPVIVYKLMQDKGHNPYFNRWFSAIHWNNIVIIGQISHNPYFNRWFSAIKINYQILLQHMVTILILIDGFLQSTYYNFYVAIRTVTILILIDGFLQ